MKKNLLTLGLLAYSLSANAQVLTYVGNNAKMFVSSGALVYSGGDWEVNSAADKTVENRGNIIIVGDYKKGTVNSVTDGKEFFNVYTNTNDYGQVKILNSAGNTDARMTIQRPAASTNYFDAIFGISFPYKDPVTYVMKSLGLNESDFKGTCPVGVNCGPDRYKMTLEKWNNDKVMHDAVITNSNFTAGDYYSINLRLQNLQAAMTGIVAYKGLPSPGKYEATGKSIIEGQTEDSFSALGYNDWKTKTNVYNEMYQTYLGKVNTTNKNYGKNVYRFGNPYTSNLDLSAISGNSNWLSILNGGEKMIGVANNDLVQGFYITKVTKDFNLDWNPISGSSDNSSAAGTYYKVVLDINNKWIGSPEALLIRPFEVFQLNFPLLDIAKLGNTRIVNVKVLFDDDNKTFAYAPVGPVTLVSPRPSEGRIANRSGKSSNPDAFYQAELFLTKDNSVIATPAYLVGSNYYNQSATVSNNANAIFVYGGTNGNVAYDSRKDINEFNSVEYIGKPLGVGFNGLKTGDTYELRFNLYEGSIFNKVKNLDEGIFYLLDKNNNQVSEISADKSYAFTASDNMGTRFEIYWKEVKPTGTLGTDTGIVKAATYVYKDLGTHKIRFEKTSPKADIEVYDISGKLVLKEKEATTGSDYVLNLPSRTVYVIKVVYQNGEVRTLKMIN